MSDLDNHELVVITTPYDMVPSDFSTALDRRQANRSKLLEWIKKGLVSGTDFS